MTDSSDKTTKRLRLIARIISAPIILYALIMLIGYGYNWVTTGTADPYAVEDYPFIENIPPILMFLAVIGLAIAWRWEKIGGIINLLFCVATLITIPFTGLDFQSSRGWMPMILVLIIAVPGILFLVYWQKSSKINNNLH